MQQGSFLGQALIKVLGADYGQRVHFIGHSLGTIVCKYACDYVHGDFSRSAANPPVAWNKALTRPHVTLMDEAELASIAGQNVTTAAALGARLAGGAGAIVAGVTALARDWKSPIPASASQLDNYISLIGLMHDDAVNVCLPGWVTQSFNPVVGHGYSYNWYRRSITELAAPPALGWRLSAEALGVFSPVSNLDYGSLWMESPTPNEPMRLVKIADPYAQECLRTILKYYSLNFASSVGQAVKSAAESTIQSGLATAAYINQVKADTIRKAGEVTVELKEKIGQGWDAFQDNAGDFAARIIPAGAGLWTLASYSGILMRNIRTGNRVGRDGSIHGVTSPYAWMTIQLPSDAGMLAFDFQVTGDPVDDCVVCAINNQNLFSLPLKFAPDAKTVSTDMMNISQFAGQEVEIMFGMTGGTAVDAELFVDGLRIISVPQPVLSAGLNGNSVELRWPASASGWSLEVSDNLQPGSWQIIPEVATSATVQDGAVVFLHVTDRSHQFYRLRMTGN